MQVAWLPDAFRRPHPTTGFFPGRVRARPGGATRLKQTEQCPETGRWLDLPRACFTLNDLHAVRGRDWLGEPRRLASYRLDCCLGEFLTPSIDHTASSAPRFTFRARQPQLCPLKPGKEIPCSERKALGSNALATHTRPARVHPLGASCGARARRGRPFAHRGVA